MLALTVTPKKGETMTGRTLPALDWEQKLMAEGMDPDEVNHRRYREELLLDRCARVQNAFENTAMTMAVMLEGGSLALAARERQELEDAHPEDGVKKAIEDFKEEFRLCVAFLNSPEGSATAKWEEAS